MTFLVRPFERIVLKVSTGSLYLMISVNPPSMEMGVLVSAEVGSSGSNMMG